MARLLRQEFFEAVYRVTSRGVPARHRFNAHDRAQCLTRLGHGLLVRPQYA